MLFKLARDSLRHCGEQYEGSFKSVINKERHKINQETKPVPRGRDSFSAQGVQNES